MKLTAITVEATGDWARAIIESNDCVFLTPPNHQQKSNSFKHPHKIQLERNEQNHLEIALWMSLDTHDAVIFHGYVASDQPFIKFKLGHGDAGWIKISSPCDSVTNAAKTGDGQNFLSYQLALTPTQNPLLAPTVDNATLECTR